MTPSDLIGHRIEIPVYYAAWMRGARTGLVTTFRRGQRGLSAYVLVKLDHPQVKQPLKLWYEDWSFAKVLDTPRDERDA
jgi:hypothetical protein